MLTWSIWTSCPQLPPASFSRARLARPILPGEQRVMQAWHSTDPPTGGAVLCPCGKWDLSVVNTTVRSVVPKITEILKPNSADIATKTETWCRNHIPNEPVCVTGYFYITKDRAGRLGGEVICFVKHGTPFNEWTEPRNNDMETLWIEFRPHALHRQFTHIHVGVT